MNNISRISSTQLQNYLGALLTRVSGNEFKSYDYYDWWATELGQHAKQWAYRTEPIGHLLFTLPLLVCEFWLPFLRKPLGIKKRVAPISVAQHGLACLELYKHTRQAGWLQSAKDDAELLVSLANPDAKGLCWGFPFVWSTNTGVIQPNQPAATQTGYGFDLFEQLWLITQSEIYRERLLSVAAAMDEEYIDLPRKSGIANTYHGRGYGDVVANAVSYRMRILAGASVYGAPHLKEKAGNLARYLLDCQCSDGSWLYGESQKNQFIDHFHTCFVLKNLFHANRILEMPELQSSLERGLAYYWENLFDENDLPKPFARKARWTLVKYESYDFAECLGLFSLFGPKNGCTYERFQSLLLFFLRNFNLQGDALRFRMYRIPTIPMYPYFRFGMTAAMLSLARSLNSPFLFS